MIEGHIPCPVPETVDLGNNILIEIDGVLENAEFDEAFGNTYLIGTIYGDVSGRFPDGRRIHTSFLVRKISETIYEDRGGRFYRIASWISYERIQPTTS